MNARKQTEKSVGLAVDHRAATFAATLVRNTAILFKSLKAKAKSTYQHHRGKKLTAKQYAANRGIPRSTFNDALQRVDGDTDMSTDLKISGPDDPLFTEIEEQGLMSYIKSKAQFGEPVTINEFLAYASQLLKKVHPERRKTNNSMSCR